MWRSNRAPSVHSAGLKRPDTYADKTEKASVSLVSSSSTMNNDKLGGLQYHQVHNAGAPETDIQQRILKKKTHKSKLEEAVNRNSFWKLEDGQICTENPFLFMT